MIGARHHAIGVCTFRRPGLADTLATLTAQQPPDSGLTILVADNDDEPSARPLVEEFARTSRHHVVYLHAPARNISIARNAILKAARARDVRYLAFLDDDEKAPPHWYGKLHDTLLRSRADAAFGPVHAIYGPRAPDWLKRTRSHDTRPETGPDGRPVAGHSCNVLIDLASRAFHGLSFDPARGRSGGEDTAFFHAAKLRGAAFVLAADAEVTEQVPRERERLHWLLVRRYRMGQTHGSLLVTDSEFQRFGQMALALSKAVWCAGAALLFLPATGRRNAALVRGSLHLGVVSNLLGLRRVQPYGEHSPAIKQDGTDR